MFPEPWPGEHPRQADRGFGIAGPLESAPAGQAPPACTHLLDRQTALQQHLPEVSLLRNPDSLLDRIRHGRQTTDADAGTALGLGDLLVLSE